MKKIDVMKGFSAARGAIEQVNYLLRGTAYRMADPGEGPGPVEDKPWLIPLTPQQKREKILEAWYYSRLAMHKAKRAHDDLHGFALQNGITVEQIDAYGRQRGYV